MSVDIVAGEVGKTQRAIYNGFKPLEHLPGVNVIRDNDYGRIYIESRHQYVPNVIAEWCNVKNHYRIYLCIVPGNGNTLKTRTGLPVMNVNNSLAANAFAHMYQILHKYRSNQKDTA